MSRKRDTNWSRDEITVLLDSIIEITRTRANDGKRTNSREVFEYAAKKMGEKGHGSRAEREKCRTKWKKMKEEFAHAKRSREGDTRYKEAPGIQPFFDRMEEFINGNFDNISPHSTIVRRTSSMSSGRPSSSGSGAASRGAGGSGSGSIGGSSSNGSGGSVGVGIVMRSSARIAANTTSGTLTNTSTSSNNVIDNQNTSSTTNLNKSNTDYPCSTIEFQSGSSPRQNHPRIPSSSNSNSTANNNTNSSGGINSAPSTSAASSTTVATNTTIQDQQHNHQLTQCPQPQSIFRGDMCIHSTATPYNNNNNSTGQNTPSANNNSLATSNLSSYANHHNDLNHHAPGSHEHADISYRVSSGCRQITIFGDHDVDIKFRGDCITINKIDIDYSSAETS